MTPPFAPRVLLPAADLHTSAAMYLAWLAHPELEGGAGGLRTAFAQALLDYRVHHTFKLQNYAAAMRLRAPGDTRRIRKRDFLSCLDRGLDGVCRSLMVLHLYHRRQTGALEAIRGTSAAEINAEMPTWTEVIRGHAERWKAILALNETGFGSRNEADTRRRLRQRVLRSCSAVLPLAHGLVTAAEEPLDDTAEAIKERILEILLQPGPWLADAVLHAQLHRHHPYPRGGEAELHPSRLVEVVWVGPDGQVAEPDVVPLTNIPPPRFARPRWSGPAQRKVVAQAIT